MDIEEIDFCQMVEDNFNKYERESVSYPLEADSLDGLDDIHYNAWKRRMGQIK